MTAQSAMTDDGGVRAMEPKDYDAIFLASFGGPEGQEDVIPFLRNVTRGRGIPDERLEEVATHYRANGGISPINAQNRALKAALEAELERRGIELPVLWGNRNWDPYIPETLQQAYDAGHRRVLAVSTSAYSSYSSCRQYREDFGMALEQTGLTGKLEVDKVRQYFDHPGFVAPFVEGLTEGLAGLRGQLQATGTEGAVDAPEQDPDARDVHVLFCTHSIPTADAEASGPRNREFAESSAYVAQHLAVAGNIMETIAEADTEWSLVYQSRSGSPQTPWLEPDVNDKLAELAADGVKGVVLVPLGFVSDHMEVIWDLDTEAMDTAKELGLAATRVPTPGIHDEFVAGLVDLICERTVKDHIADRPALTRLGPWYDVCTPGCCANRRGAKPTIAGSDEADLSVGGR